MRWQSYGWFKTAFLFSVVGCSGGEDSLGARRFTNNSINGNSELDLPGFSQAQLSEGKPLLEGVCNSSLGAIAISGDVPAGQSLNCVNGHFSGTITLNNADEDRAFGVRNILLAQGAKTKALQFTLSVCPKKSGFSTYAADQAYNRSDKGDFCVLPNVQTEGSASSYSFNMSDPHSPAHLPDPSFFELDGVFYMAGTGDRSGNTGNIEIYKSTDLFHWEFHMTAFRPDSDGDDSKLTLSNRNPSGGHTNNQRSFRHLWDGTMSLQPNNPNKILLYFSAVENRNARYADGWDPVSRTACCRDGLGCAATCVMPGDSHFFQSLLTVSIPKSDFVDRTSNKFFADESLSGGSDQPYWPAYYEAGYKYDGGRSTSSGADLSYIPSAMNPELVLTGDQEFLRRDQSSSAVSLAHLRNTFLDPQIPNAATNLAMGGNIFKDPQTSKLYLYYNWTYRGTDDALRGNHVAMALLEPDGIQLSSAASNTRPLPVAFKKNTVLRVNGVSEGQYGRTGQWDNLDSGVAEGGNAIFNRNLNKFYTVYSRNTWDSPAYAMFFKKGDALTDATLGDRNFNSPSDSREKLFLASATRSNANGPIYGGGELFEISRNGHFYYYVAFHARFFTPSGLCANQSSVCRTTYFKELSFDSNGDILPLDDSSTRGLAGDLRVYKVPRRLQ